MNDSLSNSVSDTMILIMRVVAYIPLWYHGIDTELEESHSWGLLANWGSGSYPVRVFAKKPSRWNANAITRITSRKYYNFTNDAQRKGDTVKPFNDRQSWIFLWNFLVQIGKIWTEKASSKPPRRWPPKNWHASSEVWVTLCHINN